MIISTVTISSPPSPWSISLARMPAKVTDKQTKIMGSISRWRVHPPGIKKKFQPIHEHNQAPYSTQSNPRAFAAFPPKTQHVSIEPFVYTAIKTWDNESAFKFGTQGQQHREPHHHCRSNIPRPARLFPSRQSGPPPLSAPSPSSEIDDSCSWHTTGNRSFSPT